MARSSAERSGEFMAASIGWGILSAGNADSLLTPAVSVSAAKIGEPVAHPIAIVRAIIKARSGRVRDGVVACMIHLVAGLIQKGAVRSGSASVRVRLRIRADGRNRRASKCY